MYVYMFTYFFEPLVLDFKMRIDGNLIFDFHQIIHNAISISLSISNKHFVIYQFINS